jgi:hypothetical protein
MTEMQLEDQDAQNLTLKEFLGVKRDEKACSCLPVVPSPLARGAFAPRLLPG